MHKISMKRIFKKPIFTAVEGKGTVCNSRNISVHVHLSEHIVSRVVSRVESNELTIVETSDCLLYSIRLFIC